MAGKVEMVFEPEVAKLLQGFLKINQQFTDTKNKAKGLKDETKKNKSAFDELGSSVTNQLGSMAAGFVSVGQLLAEAQKAWQAWNDQIERTGNTLSEFTNTLKAATTGRGDPYSVVRPELIDIAKSAGLNRQEIIDLYGAVGNALPFGADTQQIMAMTREAAGAKRSLGGQDLALLGTVMGTIGKTAMQDASPEDIANVAFSAIQNLGGRAAKATRPGFQRGLGALAQMGITGPEAVSMSVAAQFSGESGELFEKIAVMAIEKREEIGLKPAPAGMVEDPKTARRRALRDKYRTMTADEFTRNVLQDEEAMREFFPGSSFRVNQFAQAYEKLGPALQTAMETDAIDSQWRTLKDQPGIGTAWELERTKAGISLMPIMGGKGSQLAEARNLWLTKEESRLESLVQRNEISPVTKANEMRALRAGLAMGLYDEEVIGMLGPGSEIGAEMAANRRTQAAQTQAAFQGVSDVFADPSMAPGPVAPDLQSETAKTAENFREINNQVDRSKDEAKAVDVGDRE